MAKGKNKIKHAGNKKTKEQRKSNRKQNKKHSKEYLDPGMKVQLHKIGLGIKDIQGDGNCLFRALADQLYGDQNSDKQHKRLRQETIEYMQLNKKFFEPFFVSDEGMDFETHLELLAEDGTHAGNDAIVAFSRRFEVVVVIHQLNKPLWKIGDKHRESTTKKYIDERTKQLHISYHNGNHYNSVRKIEDLTSGNKSMVSNTSADIFIDASKLVNASCSYGKENMSNDKEEDECSDDENLSDHICHNKHTKIFEEKKHLTSTTDILEIHNHHEDIVYSGDHSVGYAVETNDENSLQKDKVPVRHGGGTGNQKHGSGVVESEETEDFSHSLNRHNMETRKKRQISQKKCSRKQAYQYTNRDTDLDQNLALAAMKMLSI